MDKHTPITIHTEPIGSILSPIDLIERVAEGESEDPNLAPLYEDAIRDTIDVANGSTCLRWLTRDTPNIEEVRAAAMRIVLDVNEVIREMIVVLRSESTRYNISVRTELPADQIACNCSTS